MSLNIAYFGFGILLPYAVEQYVYWKLFPARNNQKAEGATAASQSYGWRIVWDAAHFLVLISAGYRIIFANNSLSLWNEIGYIVFWLGVILRIWAFKELDQFYDAGIAIKPDHQIVRTGPYRVLRHPLHLGTLLEITGIALFSPLWLGAPAVLASLLVDLYLNRVEDRAHAQQFDSSFSDYYLKTWDIVDLIFWKGRYK